MSDEKHRLPAEPLPAPDDATTGLPGLHTWRAVYTFVLGVFFLWVVLLTVLTRLYS